MKDFAPVLILPAVLSMVTASKGCTLHEIEICYPKIIVNGKKIEKCRCLLCPDCPLGQGLSVQCGTRVSNSTRIECRKCVGGETYSDVHGPLMCKSCHLCDNKVVLQECTLESNRRCSKKQCKKGFYYKWSTATCERCSPCCVGEQYTSYNVYSDECRDMPEGQNCELTQKTRICPHRIATTTPQPNPGTTTVAGPTTLTPTQERDPKFLKTTTPKLQATLSQTSKRSNISKPSQGSSKVNNEKQQVPWLAIVIVLAVCVLVAICLSPLLFCAYKRKTKASNSSNSSSMTSLPDENGKFPVDNLEMNSLSKTQTSGQLVDGSGTRIKICKGPTTSRVWYEGLNQSYSESDPDTDAEKPSQKIKKRKKVFPIQDLETMLNRIPEGHLLKDLPAELFDEVEKDLNKQLVNGWRQVGIGMDVSLDNLDIFEMEYQKKDGSPARRLLNYIAARSPDALTKTFVEVLRKKERNDIAKKICDWDWIENRRYSFPESSEQPLMTGTDH